MTNIDKTNWLLVKIDVWIMWSIKASHVQFGQ